MPTQVHSLRCQNCGSPLQVNDDVRFITCNYCHTELEIVRDASTTHTQVLKNIEQNSEAAVQKLDVIEIQNEIERLDREWEMFRESTQVRRRYRPDGTYYEPSATGSILVAIGAMVFIGFWISTAVRIGAPPMFSFFGVVLLLVILFNSFRAFAASSQRASTRETYERKRAELLAALDKARR